eukprot:8740477-Alexandrium_andersonii.AAC.1
MEKWCRFDLGVTAPSSRTPTRGGGSLARMSRGGSRSPPVLRTSACVPAPCLGEASSGRQQWP